MVCLIFVVFGCKKGENLSMIEATPVSVGEEGSAKCLGCPMGENPSVIISSANPIAVCSITDVSETYSECMGEDVPYGIALLIDLGGSLATLRFHRNDDFNGSNSLSAASVKWKIGILPVDVVPPSIMWSSWSDCGNHSFSINAYDQYNVELEVKDMLNHNVVTSQFCFELNGFNQAVYCGTNNPLEMECTEGSNSPTTRGLDDPGGTGGTMTIILP